MQARSDIIIINNNNNNIGKSFENKRVWRERRGGGGNVSMKNTFSSIKNRKFLYLTAKAVQGLMGNESYKLLQQTLEQEGRAY